MSALLERLRAALAPEYDVERELASGGMGTVFLGRDTALDRPVAIKIIRPELWSAQAAERFLREARLLATLNHPNVVPIYQVGERGGFSFYVMAYLEGETLAERLTKGRLPPPKAVQLCRDLLDALEAAHRRGVVHRDIKPTNIILVEGRAILTDFGIAKSLSDPSTGLTAPGQPVGTLEYIGFPPGRVERGGAALSGSAAARPELRARRVATRQRAAVVADQVAARRGTAGLCVRGAHRPGRGEPGPGHGRPAAAPARGCGRPTLTFP